MTGLPDYLDAVVKGSGTRAWTRLIIQSAKAASRDFGELYGKQLVVNGERIRRLDVHAVDPTDHRLVIAFESELAFWDYNGGSKRDWRQEFTKLCGVSAALRVLSSTFVSGTGACFPEFLMEKLETMRADFERGEPGQFCLIFGPERAKADPDQQWLAFALERDFTLRSLESAEPLRPMHIMGTCC